MSDSPTITMREIYTMSHGMPGMRYVVTNLATAAFEDWSACRSPSRAKRREKLGHPQRVVRGRKPACYQIGGILHIHPELERRLREKMSADFDAAAMRALTGFHYI